MRAAWIVLGCLGLTACHLIYPFHTVPVDGGVADAESGVEDGQPAFLPGWTYRKRITISAGEATTALKDFPLLVLRTSDKELARGASSDGHDIAFTAEDGTTRLVHELEGFSPDTGALTAWVRVPSLAASVDTILYLYYGNAGATQQQDASTVWGPAGYVGVWHLQNLADISDAAGTSQPGKRVGGVTSAAGKIVSAARFDGKPTTWIDLGDGALAADSPFTLEAWFKPLSAQAGWVGIATKGRKANYQWVGVWIKPSGVLSFGWSWLAGAKGNLDAAAKPAPGAWHHAAATFDGAEMRLYLDGRAVSTAKQNTYQAISQPLIVGCDRTDSNPSIDGIVDEVRLSRSARSAAWIKAQHDNQSAPESFHAVGVQERGTGSP